MPNLGADAPRTTVHYQREGGGILKPHSISNVSVLMDPKGSRTKQVRPGQAAGVRFSSDTQQPDPDSITTHGMTAEQANDLVRRISGLSTSSSQTVPPPTSAPIQEPPAPGSPSQVVQGSPLLIAMPQATAMDRGAQQQQPVLTDQQIQQNVHQYKSSMTDQPYQNNNLNTAEQAIAQYKTSSQNSSQASASLPSGQHFQIRQRQGPITASELQSKQRIAEQQQAQGSTQKKRNKKKKKKKKKQKKTRASEYCNMIPNMVSPNKYNQPNPDSPDSQESKKSDETLEYAAPQVQNQSDF